MLKLASRAEARTGDAQIGTQGARPQGRAEGPRPQGRAEGRAGAPAGGRRRRPRAPSKVTCFIMKPDGVRKRRPHADHRRRRLCPVARRARRLDRQPRRGLRGHRPGRRAGRERRRRQRPGRHRRHRRRPAHLPPRGGPRLDRRAADLRQRPGRAPSATRWPQVKLPGRRAAHILPIAWSVDGQGGVRDPRAMFGRTLGVELLVGLGLRGGLPDPGRLRRARPPAVRRRGRRALRLGARRARGGRDGPGLASASTWAAARPRRRCSPPAPWSTSRPCRSAAST